MTTIENNERTLTRGEKISQAMKKKHAEKSKAERKAHARKMAYSRWAGATPAERKVAACLMNQAKTEDERGRQIRNPIELKRRNGGRKKYNPSTHGSIDFGRLRNIKRQRDRLKAGLGGKAQRYVNPHAENAERQQ